MGLILIFFFNDPYFERKKIYIDRQNFSLIFIFLRRTNMHFCENSSVHSLGYIISKKIERINKKMKKYFPRSNNIKL